MRVTIEIKIERLYRDRAQEDFCIKHSPIPSPNLCVLRYERQKKKYCWLNTVLFRGKEKEKKENQMVMHLSVSTNENHVNVFSFPFFLSLSILINPSFNSRNIANLLFSSSFFLTFTSSQTGFISSSFFHTKK